MQKIKNKMHTARVKLRNSTQLQILLYGGLVFVFFVMGILILSDWSKAEFIKYEMKQCLDKREVEESAPSISYETDGPYIIVSYDFTQKCYGKMDFDYSLEGRNIRMVFMPKNMNDECVCDTEFAAKIGPLDLGGYVVEVVKETGAQDYTVKTATVKVV